MNSKEFDNHIKQLLVEKLGAELESDINRALKKRNKANKQWGKVLKGRIKVNKDN